MCPLCWRSQEDIKISGHSIECRINAEDPFQNFRPGPGRVVGYLPPGGPNVRMDSHLYPDYLVSERGWWWCVCVGECVCSCVCACVCVCGGGGVGEMGVGMRFVCGVSGVCGVCV